MFKLKLINCFFLLCVYVEVNPTTNRFFILLIIEMYQTWLPGHNWWLLYECMSGCVFHSTDNALS